MAWLRNNMKYFFLLMTLAGLMSCGKSRKKIMPLFQVQTDDKTGLHFNNKLKPTQQFNIFHWCR
jgi:hypothetical protein